jgi:FKBP-type peptidyl-prolyl cis-trans isomerase FkpA
LSHCCPVMPNYLRMNRLIIPILVLILTACEPPVQEKPETGPDPVAEEFIRANQYMRRRHQDHIAAFVERVGWKAQVTPSGLWIVLEDPGSGPLIEENNLVTYTFSSSLLDGSPCYEATDSAPKQIIVGRGGVESGVEEGLKTLRKGSRAIFLIPPHLGHGNFGDRVKIPGNSVLIYRLVIKDVKQGA